MSKFSEFFQEDHGGYSATRLIFIFGCVTIFLVWAGVCIYKQTFQSFDGTHVTMIGTLAALKVGSKMTEAKDKTDV